MVIIAVVNYIRYFLNKLKEDAVSAYAAQAAFFVILSFFPFAMLLMTLIQYLPVTEEMLIQMAEEGIPNTINVYVISLIHEIYIQPSTAIISATVIAAIWSASKGFLAIIRGFNSVYGIHESRNYFLIRLIASGYTAIFALVIVVALSVLVFGNKIFIGISDKIPVLSDLAFLIISLRTAVGFLIMFSFFWMLYIWIPNRRAHIWSEIPGALLTSVGWLGFSYLYSFYIDNFANFDTYGSLTVIVLLMLWLYACMYIVFIGGEVNVVFQNGDIYQLFLEMKRGIKKGN